jgi:hypothetical protein
MTGGGKEAGFSEAVARFANVKPHELKASIMDKKEGRVRESDLVLPTLRLLSERTGGFIETKELIEELTLLFNPSGRDAEIIEGRSDTYFSQKVRNLVSHRASANSFVTNGFAEYAEKDHGFRITQQGRDILKRLNG